MENTKIIILAAGKGTRMYSSTPKVMHKIGSFPLLGHILQKTYDTPNTICSVVTLQNNCSIEKFIKKNYPKVNISFQTEQLGTADAVKLALQSNTFHKDDNVIVLFGDTPFIDDNLIKQIELKLSQENKIVVVGTYPNSPNAYGRLVCDSNDGLEKIVEYKVATDAERKITFCNSGIMGFKYSSLINMLSDIKMQTDSKEYYLTDIIGIARRKEIKISVIKADYDHVRGINNQTELAEAEKKFQDNMRINAMQKGVNLIAPNTVYFAYDTVIGSGSIIEPNVFFGTDVNIGSNVHIKSFSYVNGVKIHDNVTVGPFANIRPGTEVHEGAKIGNFVEIKNSNLDKNSKVNHLSYIGDSKIGKNVNIGAGTITCNYDGYLKHNTIIEDEVFIGSNSCLVAPVTIGKRAIIGAGSTITKDVSAESLALSRTEQSNIPNLAKKIHLKKQLNLNRES